MIETEMICTYLINALKKAGYKESTVFYYQGVVRRFLSFCKAHDVKEYTPDFGSKYANDFISKMTGKFSHERFQTQGRFIRLLDSYYNTGNFSFATQKRKWVPPDNPVHRYIFVGYQKHLRQNYSNEQTIYYYEYELYAFLQHLNSAGIDDMDLITPKTVFHYIQNTNNSSRQRSLLCGVKSFFRYLNRNDLLEAIAGIHAIRTKKIIPTLTNAENKKLEEVLNSEKTSLRNKAIILLGLSSGIRACDLINLKLADVDWATETISFCQSKTGNFVCLPLIPSVGNALFRYLSEERPKTNNDYIFVRKLAPFDPLSSHSACYAITKKIFNKAGIKKNNRIFGMNFLRHNAASVMVRNEVPIETIAAILGHSSPDSTAIYITTDERKLVECVLPLKNISTEVHS